MQETDISLDSDTILNWIEFGKVFDENLFQNDDQSEKEMDDSIQDMV